MKEVTWGRPVTDIERSLRRVAPDGIFWIPATTPAGLHDPSDPFAPYIFVLAPMDARLKRANCIERCLTELVHEADLTASVGRAAPLTVGMAVRVNAGPYKGVSGTVRRMTVKSCVVRVALESGDRDIPVPRDLIETL